MRTDFARYWCHKMILSQEEYELIDVRRNNKKYEEKLKLITLAYTQLKNTYRKKIDT